MSTTLAPNLSAPALTRQRIASVDLLRGLLMIVMALDHVRDFFTNVHIDPTDPTRSWPALFLTRWVTHICAPGFVALAGTAVYLQRQRGRSRSQTAKRLVSRGLWLIFVELAIVSFAIYFNYSVHLLEVIWAIGGSMILLAALQYLPVAWVAVVGFSIVFFHNLLDSVDPARLGHFTDLWILLFSRGPILLHGRMLALVAYALVPWTGVMALGYAFGAIVLAGPARRRRLCSLAGAAFLLLFAVLRAAGLYGDPAPFQHLATRTQTAMSFFDVTKYPPSLEYIAATWGVLLLLFALGDWLLQSGRLKRTLGVIEVYGRVPFFYFVVHLYLAHILVIIVAAAMVYRLHVPFPQANQIPAWWGFGLPVVYLIWAAIVAALYRPCLWFSRLKARRKDWWLSYL